jgi:cell division protein ZapE
MRHGLTEIYDSLVAQGILRPDAGQRALLPRLETLRQWLEGPTPSGLRGLFRRAPAPPRGMYLWGGVGRGKSMLMDLFVAQTDCAGKRRVHFHAFMQDIQTRLHAARQKNLPDALVPVTQEVSQGLRLLAFDEMQISDIADAMVVGRVFQILLDAGVVIVTTSNRPPDDLYKNGLNRALFLPFIELLKTRLDVIEIESETDYRQHRLAGEQVYFHPAGAHSRARIDALWQDLTGGDPGHPLHLEVKGRQVVLPRHHNGVARVTFWDLCGQPLGPADYLALAQSVRVLMIDDIPRLSAANFNEARRFVTLIDTLYDGGIQLIASAADIPDRLYLEGEGVFEFARTASRLTEMQSADWPPRVAP